MPSKEPPALTFMSLISEALANGYDIVLRFTPTADGKEGKLRLPNSWAERLGLDVEALRKQTD